MLVLLQLNYNKTKEKVMEYSVNLTQAEMSLVLEGVGNMACVRVNGTFNKLVNLVNEQNEAKVPVAKLVEPEVVK